MKKKNIIIISVCCVLAMAAIIILTIYIANSRTEEAVADAQGKQNKQETSQDADRQEETREPEVVEPATIVFTGDVLLSNYVLRNYDSKGIGGVLSPALLETLNSSDVTMINNEFPYSIRGTQAPDKQYTFRVNPSYVSVIQEMGVDIAGLANNHVLDFGKEALQDTFTTLQDAGIDYTGAGNSSEEASRLVTREINGATYGFLAASRVIPVGSWNVDNSTPGVFTTYDPAALLTAISEAKKTCDYVYVSVHWGTEHTDVLNAYQTAMAHQYIDAGADAVIGSHPHVLQGIEYYNGKPVFYSLGNFIFNQNIARTVAVEITVDGEGNTRIRLVPASAQGAYTHEVSGDEAESIYSYLESISSTVSIDENGYISVK